MGQVNRHKEPRRTLKTRAHAVTLFCALGSARPACAARIPRSSSPPRPGFSFPQRQTLTYSVDWRVFPAGTAVIHFEAAGDRERIIASAYTSGAINLLFHVADNFQSDFDREKGCTYDFDKQTVEGRRQIQLDPAHRLRQLPIHPRRKESWSMARPSTQSRPCTAA